MPNEPLPEFSSLNRNSALQNAIQQTVQDSIARNNTNTLNGSPSSIQDARNAQTMRNLLERRNAQIAIQQGFDQAATYKPPSFQDQLQTYLESFERGVEQERVRVGNQNRNTPTTQPTRSADPLTRYLENELAGVRNEARPSTAVNTGRSPTIPDNHPSLNTPSANRPPQRGNPPRSAQPLGRVPTGTRISNALNRPINLPSGIGATATTGAAAGAIGVGIAIAEGANPGQAAAVAVGSIGGGIGGQAAGAAIGGGIGFALAGPPGAAVGMQIGGGAGLALGSYGGGKAVNAGLNFLFPPGAEVPPSAESVPPDPKVGPPPFTGGQGNGVQYAFKVKAKYYTTTNGGEDCGVDEDIIQGTAWGPLQSIRALNGAPIANGPCAGKTAFALFQLYCNGIYGAPGETGFYPILQSAGFGGVYFDLSLMEAKRLDGLPDTDGDPPGGPVPTDTRTPQSQGHPQGGPGGTPNGTNPHPGTPNGVPSGSPAASNQPASPNLGGDLPGSKPNPAPGSPQPNAPTNGPLGSQVPPAAVAAAVGTAAVGMGGASVGASGGGASLSKPPSRAPQTVQAIPTPTGQRPSSGPEAQPAAPPPGEPPPPTNTKSPCSGNNCSQAIRNDIAANAAKLKDLEALMQGVDLGLLVAMQGQLSQINQKLGGQVEDGVSGLLGKAFGLAKKTWNFLQIDRVLNLLTFITVLHNAYFLSQGLAQTLFSAVSQSLSVFGVEDEDGNPLDVGQIVSKYTDGFFKQIFGVENVNGIKAEWKKYSRIYQAASNILFALQSIGYSILESLEVVGNYVAWIGNALKRFGAVGEKAYRWMNPDNNFSQNRFFNALNNIQEAVEAVDQVSGELLSIQDTWSELGTYKNNLDNAVAGLDENGEPIAPKFGSPENVGVAEAETQQKVASQSAPIAVSDEQFQES
ncbi:hypothetical protein IQ268_30550 [Oculatella sp. LEGE 06141]|uniref:hypothetical protein n=1 Tax=Oculatella sp. LEGE 06141 TaxID=1828648 RepID=UPI001882512E|nr:hypothetical protein [Oculatella sp. LEGE 06141]MBE9182879.1 hypothetical protein [Oculatella sp. LEGE 06141]